MSDTRQAIYSTEQIRQFEQLAETHFKISSATLMQRAGKAAFEIMTKHWPQAKNLVIFCGSGNNGGDGYALASLAVAHGLSVSIWQVGDIEKLSKHAMLFYRACYDANIPIEPFHETIDLSRADLVVDAICGIGLHEPLRHETAIAVAKLQTVTAPVFALDVPTGIEADTGKVLGIAVKATLTLTFIGLKPGLLTGHGVDFSGTVICDDLHLPSEIFNQINPIANKLTNQPFVHYLKPRTRDWHKGMSGSVLVIGGMPGFSGATRLAAEAALRMGAGLVTIATHPDHANSLNAARPEIMCQGIHHPDELVALIERADVIALGPGLGQSEWSEPLFDEVIRIQKPMLIDADGLNLLANKPFTSNHWILTPHPGEAARLLQQTTTDIQNNRLAAIRLLQKKYGGAIVLKGAGSLVLGEAGCIGLCDKGNPGMATAGMGDVLSGVISGLLAQGLPLTDAAKLGVLLHAEAGDLAAANGQRGMLALDLMPYLRQLSNLN